MSITILQKDNINVIGNRGFIMEYDKPNIEEGTKVDTIDIDLQILVNGKIRNIRQSYEIVENKKLEYIENRFHIKDYTKINTLNDILRDLGYDIDGLFSGIINAIEEMFNI